MPEKITEANIAEPLQTQEECVDAVNQAYDAVRDSSVSNEIDELQDYIFDLKAGLEFDDKIGRMQKIQSLMSAVVGLLELFDVEIERLRAEADHHINEKEAEKKNNMAIYAAIHFEDSKDPALQDKLHKSLAVISQHSQAISEANSQRVIYQADKIKYDVYKETLELPYSIACEYARRLGVIAVEQAAIDQLPDTVAIPAPPAIKAIDQTQENTVILESAEINNEAVVGSIDFFELDLLMQKPSMAGPEYIPPKRSYVHYAVNIPEPIPQPEPELKEKTKTRTLPEILAATRRPKLSINAQHLSGKEIAHRLTAK